MRTYKKIVGIGILIIILLIVKLIVIPLYFAFFANIYVTKYSDADCSKLEWCPNAINITTEELKQNPAIDRVINGEGCSGSLCLMTQDEWIKTKNFLDNKSVNSPQYEYFKFENHDGVYMINTRRG